MALAGMSSIFADILDTAIRDAKRDLIRCAGMRKGKSSLSKETHHEDYSLVGGAGQEDGTQYSPRASLPGLSSLSELNQIFAHHSIAKQPCITFASMGQTMFDADITKLAFERSCPPSPLQYGVDDKVEEIARGWDHDPGVSKLEPDIAKEDNHETCAFAGIPDVTFSPVDRKVISRGAVGFPNSPWTPKSTISLSPCLLQVASGDISPRKELPGEISPISLCYKRAAVAL